VLGDQPGRPAQKGVMYEGPGGEVFQSLQEVYEHVVAARIASADADKSKVHLSVLQHFLNERCSEKEEHSEEDRRFVVTSSTLEDYLYRGDHPVVANMSLYVYCTWVYRIEKPPPRRADQPPARRYVDMEFAPSYALKTTHLQRLATEFRVPLFEGYTMPSATVCSESAALYKQLLLRPLAVASSDEPEDVQLVQTFAAFCPPPDGATAFNRGWLQFSSQQATEAAIARHRFLARYEWPSVWETAEVQQTLLEMHLEEQRTRS